MNKSSTPAMAVSDKIEYWNVDDLVPYIRNAKRHPPEQVAQIAASIEEFGFTIPILVAEEGTIIAGHGRLLAAQQLGYENVPVLVASGWTDEQRRAYTLADNKLSEGGEWDDELIALELGELRDAGFDIGLIGYSPDEIDAMLDAEEDKDEPGRQLKTGSLSEQFGVPPFSVLNARDGWWQERKRAWLALGIRSELGRGAGGVPSGHDRPAADYAQSGARGDGMETASLKGGLTWNTTPNPYRAKKGKRKANAQPSGGGGGGWKAMNEALAKNRERLQQGAGLSYGTTDWMREKGLSGGCSDGDPAVASGTSIFDPVLCELAYRWFSPVGGTILDPFAGGSVRGIVAAKLGRNYVGCDLRAEQVEANRIQGGILCPDNSPVWHVGDSRQICQHAEGTEADMIFSCPPYADLEVYSDDPADISTMAYDDFRTAYFEIVAEACKLLKNDRFACFVVGEVRDKKGNYYSFVPDTVEAFRRAGLSYYNEAILVTAAGSLAIRTRKQFEVSRKIGKTHQNVLVFVKGNAKKATQAIGPVEFGDLPDDNEGTEE